MRMSLSNASNPVKVLLLIGVLISPWLFSQAVIFVIASDQEIESMPICESNSGNCAHLGGGENYRINNSLPTQIDINSSQAWVIISNYIEDNNGKILIENGNGINYYVHFVEKTSFWNFPDDVVIQISGNDEGCVIEIHSESRLGWGDLGINPERINKIHELLV
ncbi:MAG: hypothetical protein CMA81_06510 [Euryarchaeota archaeon]|nr:hypothetical protein [Euryarchaeota archaeon]